MNEAHILHQPVICEDCADTDEPRTMYVHFCSGDVTAVKNVTGVRYTERQVIFVRDGRIAAVFPRSSVYSTCCEPDEPPSPC